MNSTCSPCWCIVAKRVRAAAVAAAHEGDDNTPSGPAGQGVKKHIIAIKTIHLCPIQQKLHRPRCLFGHDSEAFGHYPNSGEGYTHFLHGYLSVIVILLVLWPPSRFLIYRLK